MFNLEGYRIGLVANFNCESKLPINDPTSDSLAQHFIDLGAQVIVVPWRELLKEKVNFYDYSSRSILSNESLSNSIDLLHLRDLGPLSNEEDNFKRFLDALGELKMPITNSLPSIRKNLSKNYLLEFLEAGLPVPELVVVNSVEEFEDWKSTIAKDFCDIVFKPLNFGELGSDVHLASKLDYQKVLSSGRSYIAQRYMPEIAQGEIRLVFVGREFSHGVLKVIEDNFKTSSQKLIVPYIPSNFQINLAHQIMDQWKEDFDVMRIDLVGNEMDCQIIEIEMINPNLHEESLIDAVSYPQLLASHFCTKYPKIGELSNENCSN